MLGNFERKDVIFLSIRKDEQTQSAKIFRKARKEGEQNQTFDYLIGIPRKVEKRDVEWQGKSFVSWELTFEDTKDPVNYILSVGNSLILSTLLTLNGNVEGKNLEKGVAVKVVPYISKKTGNPALSVTVDGQRVNWNCTTDDIPKAEPVIKPDGTPYMIDGKVFRDDSKRKEFLQKQVELFNQRYNVAASKDIPEDLPADDVAAPVVPPPTTPDSEPWNEF